MLQLTTIIFLIAFSTLAVIHILALHFALYWYFWWFDMPVHAFGGVIISLGLFTLRDLKLFSNRNITFIKVMLLVLAIALVWEAFEIYVGLSSLREYVDTLSDIFRGICGGAFGYVLGTSLRHLR